MRKSRLKNIGVALRTVYKPTYIIINIIVAIIYYFLITELVRYQNKGILLLTAPTPLIYALVISASIMFTLGIYAIKNTLRSKRQASASAIGTITTLFTSIITGCGCSAPLLYSITALGLSISEVSSLEVFLVKYTIPIISIMLAINVLLILYYLNKISKTCRI
jgi:hypothetical protein